MAGKKQSIEHLRAEVPGPPGSALEKTLYESRGVRYVAIEVFRDHRLTIEVAALKETPAERYESLLEASSHWLRDDGEKTFLEVAALAEKAKSEAPATDASAIDDTIFADWVGGVRERHGYLSPAAIAAHFLAASDYLHRRMDPGLATAVYAFADAYHWMHFEGTTN